MVGVEDLFEQRPVFERDGLRERVRGTACLPEEIVPDFFLQMVAKKSGREENGNLLYPGVSKMGCFPADGGGGKAEGGVVGFQVELQQEGR